MSDEQNREFEKVRNVLRCCRHSREAVTYLVVSFATILARYFSYLFVWNFRDFHFCLFFCVYFSRFIFATV